MIAVLLLNTTYEPMHVVSLRRAVALVLQDKAHLVEISERSVRSPSLALPEPSVIRLRGRAPVARQRVLPLSRSAVLARDAYTCQYCGLTLPAGRLTIDHVLPQSRGGGWSWTNLVAACPACNAAKANRTPEEAGMALLRPPGKPIGVQAALLHDAQRNPAWRPYLWTT
jgi:5-methylcytosine-specific restriction endonuclease McrA